MNNRTIKLRLKSRKKS